VVVCLDNGVSEELPTVKPQQTIFLTFPAVKFEKSCQVNCRVHWPQIATRRVCVCVCMYTCVAVSTAYPYPAPVQRLQSNKPLFSSLMFSFCLLILPSVLSPALSRPVPNSLWRLYFSAWNIVCCLRAIHCILCVFGVVSPRIFAPMCLLASPCQRVTNQDDSIFVKFGIGRFH
jgi:hypothetical protein